MTEGKTTSFKSQLGSGSIASIENCLMTAYFDALRDQRMVMQDPFHDDWLHWKTDITALESNRLTPLKN